MKLAHHQNRYSPTSASLYWCSAWHLPAPEGSQRCVLCAPSCLPLAASCQYGPIHRGCPIAEHYQCSTWDDCKLACAECSQALVQSDRVRRQAHGLKQVWRHSKLLQQLLSQTSTISRHCVLAQPTQDMSDGRIRLQCTLRTHCNSFLHKCLVTPLVQLIFSAKHCPFVSAQQPNCDLNFSSSGLKTLLSLRTSAWARTSADSNAAQPHDLQDRFHYLHRAHIARLQSMLRLYSAYASAIHHLFILQETVVAAPSHTPPCFVTMAHTRSPAATSCLWHQLGILMQEAIIVLA